MNPHANNLHAILNDYHAPRRRRTCTKAVKQRIRAAFARLAVSLGTTAAEDDTLQKRLTFTLQTRAGRYTCELYDELGPQMHWNDEGRRCDRVDPYSIPWIAGRFNDGSAMPHPAHTLWPHLVGYSGKMNFHGLVDPAQLSAVEAQLRGCM
jgi:hypothetical protein